MGIIINCIHHAEDTEVLDGYVTSLLYITAQASARSLTVKCVASNSVGYVEDVSEAHLTCKYKPVVSLGYTPVYQIAQRHYT